jgi:hypothetical protein
VPESKEPLEIAAMLQSDDPQEREAGYQDFLTKTYWTPGATVEDVKNLVCQQFFVKPNKVVVSIKQIEPQILYASQDALQYDKLKMVEAAGAHCKAQKLDLPPIAVWMLYGSPMRYIVHDGHHRTYYAYRYATKLTAMILEPMGAYDYIEQRLSYAFQLHKRVIDLPIVRK